MNFNEHSELKGQHALFSPSQSAWLRYDKKKIVDKIMSVYRAPLGTEIHEFAAIQIKLRNKITSIRQLKSSIATFIYSKYEVLEYDPNYAMKLVEMLDYIQSEVFDTVKEYINDGIGFKMNPEQILYYSEDIFGTADTIIFRDNFLRIHDLKTGALPAHMEQLEVYEALFCLEYKIKPHQIKSELRLYQSGEVLVHTPEPDNMVDIIDQIVKIGETAEKVREGGK